MLYECDLNGVPVSCQLIEYDYEIGKYLIEYEDKAGRLRLYVNPDKIKGPAVPHEISQ